MKTTCQIFIIVLSLMPLSIWANGIDAGQQLYQQCISCHGQKGEGNPQLNAPALAGQFDWYLSRQLENFQNDLRGNHPDDHTGQQMAAIAALLKSQDEITAVSAYLASLSPVTNNEAIAADPRQGAKLYHAKCGACHGSAGQGNVNFNAPNLQGQHASYLISQFAKFKDGHRGTEKQDKLGRQMKIMAGTLTSEQQLLDVLGFIQLTAANGAEQ